VGDKVKPAAVIAIDALASRRTERLCATVQLCDTGVSPGAGVGNMRKGINKETLGVPVIAIGVPLVVYASTISQDAITLLAQETGLHSDEGKLVDMVQKVMDEKLGPLVVTPKEIDVMVSDMSKLLADGINLALHALAYDEVKALLT
jgi:spore protease